MAIRAQASAMRSAARRWWGTVRPVIFSVRGAALVCCIAARNGLPSSTGAGKGSPVGAEVPVQDKKAAAARIR